MGHSSADLKCVQQMPGYTRQANGVLQDWNSEHSSAWRRSLTTRWRIASRGNATRCSDSVTHRYLHQGDVGGAHDLMRHMISSVMYSTCTVAQVVAPRRY